MLEEKFDIEFAAKLALREKQIQQVYRPIIAVHKWFARRPGTLFRNLMISEFCDGDPADEFYRSQDLHDKLIGDPFMGGGTPLIEANRMSASIIGTDVNPMAYWIVREELLTIDLAEYEKVAWDIRSAVEREVGEYYVTRCIHCDSKSANVKYFIWVKVLTCESCESSIDLFPGYLLSKDTRHVANVFMCSQCGELNESDSKSNPGACSACDSPIAVKGPAKRGTATCPECGHSNRYPRSSEGPPKHRLVAIEYHCAECSQDRRGRLFKNPDLEDHERVESVRAETQDRDWRFVPGDEILPGEESSRLIRWGYRNYRDMFNSRQLLGLETLASQISSQPDRIRRALATNLSDLLRYQNMLCRYDTMALKSLDIFSIHGFPVGLVQCESNFLGIPKSQNRFGVNIGSGGWSNIVAKYIKAKEYADHPFEHRFTGTKKKRIWIQDEWIGEQRSSSKADSRRIDIRFGDARALQLHAEELDAVFTDPPYLGNVQYAELMDFCYVWLKKMFGSEEPAFAGDSTRHEGELTSNTNMGRDISDYAVGLSEIFSGISASLRQGAPFVFTFHHNEMRAYTAVASAILDASLVCSASFPAPAEMSASIHIAGTGSSIIDTVFVCRTTGSVPLRWICRTADELSVIVAEEGGKLSNAGVKLTVGDLTCIVQGHLTRLAVWNLRNGWDEGMLPGDKMSAVGDWINSFGSVEAIIAGAGLDISSHRGSPQLAMFEPAGGYEADSSNAIPF